MENSNLKKVSKFNPKYYTHNLRGWWNYMISTFGFNSLFILCVVYWSQGFRQFGVLASTLYYMDDLKLDPATAQIIRTFTFTAWYIKPIYGMFSDNIPIFGYRRRAYMILASLLGISAYLSILFTANLYWVVFALILGEFGQAISDVIADAIMVEESRKDPVGGSGSLQSFCWITLSFGGFIGSILGGLFLNNFDPKYVIASQAICPFLCLVVSVKLDEEPVADPISFQTIFSRICLLWDACKKPQIYKPLIFIFLSNALSPSFYELMLYFMKNELDFSPMLLSTLNIVGYVALGFGGFAYNKFFKSWSFPKILGAGQVLSCICGIFDILFVLKAYEYIHFSAVAFAISGDTLSGIISFTFKSMPLMVLSGKLCPEGVEATLFALFASISNFSYAVSIFFGGMLTQWFRISATNFDFIWILMVIRALTKLIPLPFLGLLPQEESKNEDEIIELEVLDEPFAV